MSRGHGRVQRWLLEEGLTERPEDLGFIGHRWLCYINDSPCTNEVGCCEDPNWQAGRAERESLRRAIKKLADEGARVRRGHKLLEVRWSSDHRPKGVTWGMTWQGPLVAGLIPVEEEEAALDPDHGYFPEVAEGLRRLGLFPPK